MTEKTKAAFEDLLKILKRLDRLGSIGGLLGWDEAVNLPPGGVKLRGEQQGLFTEIHHREATNPRIGELLDMLESKPDELDAAARAVIRDARKDYDRITRIPAEFSARRAEARTASYHAWVEARAADDFSRFLPHLEKQLAFSREEAAYLEAEDPYDYWVDQFDPGMSRAVIDPLFEGLLPELKGIVETILAAPDQPDSSIFRGFPVDRQEAFLREVVRAIGFDFDHGRIDSTVHPFCGGHPLDIRMTTRFHPDNPLDSLSSAVHETGHALYEQGLRDEFAGTALGDSVGMAFHESQSRMWENQVGRSRAFWKYWEPRYREAFPEQLRDVDSETLYRAINKVGLTPIRVDADEVTYNLHIMLRYEMERGLFDGSLAPRDLPDAWNEASARIIGYTPDNDREGCLQDVHWSEGMFGYFPSYCLGNLLAAQLWYHVRDQLPDLDEAIARADFQPLLDWLRENIHARGRLEYTRDFIRSITGGELSHSFLVRYLKERYLPLYTRS